VTDAPAPSPAAAAPSVETASPSPLARMVIAAIRGYQYAFSWTRPNCRFWPTCSQYTLLAVKHHGAWQGLFLGARRIGRCHPWNPGGHDPVPGAEIEHTFEAGAPSRRCEG
jgi:putative membrane protein insertion efficiency factor